MTDPSGPAGVHRRAHDLIVSEQIIMIVLERRITYIQGRGYRGADARKILSGRAAWPLVLVG